MLGKSQRLDEILNEKQIHHVVTQSIGEDVAWELRGSEVKPAVDGIAGFLGDHMKAVLHLDVHGERKDVYLFIKRIPANNLPKNDFIDENHYFRREMLMYRVIDDIYVNGSTSWCARAYIYTESILVMPDLNKAGYTSRHFLETLDTQHILLTSSSLARFHSAFVNYETKKSIDLKRPYSTMQEYGHLLNEPTYRDCPPLRAAAKLAANLLKSFSTKTYRNVPGQSKFYELFLKACHSLTEYKGSVNVLLHKDLWVNNILFKYDNGVPTNALIIDFQCLRYAPPAFDLMIFLYLVSDRNFRQQHEKDVFDMYYSIFVDNLTIDSKKRMEGLGYDKGNFLDWCEKARMFGILEAISIYPFILMDPKTAQKVFDDPETYDKHINCDRSEPVLAHASKCKLYKDRNVEVIEDFVERYALN